NPPSGSSWAQLAIDLAAFSTYVPTSTILNRLIRMAVATRELPAGKVFTGRQGKPRDAAATGVLILLLESDESYSSARLYEIAEQVNVVNAVLRRPVGAVIVTIEKFA